MMSKDLTKKIITFSGQTAGRDKFYRTCQYGSKLLWWCLEQGSGDPDLIRKVKTLEKTIGTSRKLFRFGKSFDAITAAMKTIHLPDVFLSFTITLAKLNQSVYLLIDHTLWAHRIGLVEVDSKRLSNLSTRFWLATLILNLSRDLYELSNVLNDAMALYAKRVGGGGIGNHYTSNGVDGRDSQHLSTNNNSSQLDFVILCLQQNMPVVLDLVKNTADIFLPLSSLGYLPIPVGVQGLCGLISSLVGLSTVWESTLKIQP
ncbi:peroxisomal membrane protein 11B-like [Asterias rubens]|uniref:peroxisomal membrane protein 11B-like n=1 Tax=Asterias rubens TaxID=7604 RepID=UPI00145503C1|nr:peroxisomal membrane protein 11B-like [Asterias rubens]XP_033643834.1 peroxisomal membrane protein 11B-like [Asterias rubens]XP_033643835.1 peroxisomal membrane protein 11B-like [Asterias rubens]